MKIYPETEPFTHLAKVPFGVKQYNSLAGYVDYKQYWKMGTGSLSVANVPVPHFPPTRIKRPCVLKRLIEADGGGMVWIDHLFRCNLAHGVTSCPRWSAEW